MSALATIHPEPPRPCSRVRRPVVLAGPGARDSEGLRKFAAAEASSGRPIAAVSEAMAR